MPSRTQGFLQAKTLPPREIPEEYLFPLLLNLTSAIAFEPDLSSIQPRVDIIFNRRNCTVHCSIRRFPCSSSGFRYPSLCFQSTFSHQPHNRSLNRQPSELPDMHKKRVKLRSTPNLNTRLRREANHDRDLGAMARLRGERAAALRAEQDPLADYAFFDDNAPPYEPDYTSAFEHTTADQDYDEPEWITLVTDQPDEFDVQIQATIERWRQQALFFNWNDLWEEFHGEYMAQKLRTDDWTSSKSYHDFAACKCPAHLKTHRMVDLVDVHSQRRERVAFCDCTRDAVRLLWMGFIPGSPVTPVAAFSMPILILHNCLWNQTHFGALPFTNAMQEYLEPRSERLTTRNGQKARSLRKPFTAAVDLYRQMEDMTDTLMNDVLELSEQQKYEISVQPPSTRIRLCLSLDGNFQHRHYLKSSRNYDTFRSPRIFLTPEEVDRVDAAIREKELQKKPADKRDRCTESHKAADDKRNESTWKGCDDTGLMGACCRHDAAIYMANISKSGERRCYPMALLESIIQCIEPDRKVGVLYDIGCSLDKFMNLVSNVTAVAGFYSEVFFSSRDTGDDQRGLLEEERHRLQFGTSIFHAYVHSWACQLEYNPRFHVGWGMSDGEGLERMWSYLSPLVTPLRYATRNHRLAALAHRLKYHNARSIQTLPTWLKRKFNNAITCYFETKDALDALLRQANPFSPGNRFAIDFFRRQWEDQRNFQSAHNDAEEDRRQKLVSIFNKEGALQVLRTRLSHVHQHLTSAEDVNDLLDKIETTAADLSRETEAYTRGGQPIPQGQQQKELLLLWSAKSVLFVQMVHLRAEEQPLNDSGSGHHLGTKGKEKVMAATKTRRPMVNKLIKRFNDQFSSFIRNFPDQQVANVADHPLTYNNLKSWPLDHRFWNDGLYHHSTAPWAIDMRVREGINCVLALDRAREEFDLIAEELARALNWAASWYNGQCRLMGYLKARAEQLRLNTGEVAPDHVDDLTVGKCGREEKIRLIAQELGRRLLKHGSMVLEWASDVAWLTSRCELVNNGEHVVTYSLWLNLIQQCLQDRSTRIQDVALDDAEEEAIMQVHVDDGEEIVSMRPGGAEGDNEADEHSDTAEVGDDTAMGDS
ncbi:hypothetical protein MJO28_010824 [Puccinia striiformis f. sp. tritici]|uniref:Uncharacterized protein n=1 Tax=Puccinia striiformis f. sp. tritici TaxID=168172 RepID=A0ACC0E774_9BASI|nr:hypothetical protein MJO28_010824 [Puccinia striiformis f. sp. tritici]